MAYYLCAGPTDIVATTEKRDFVTELHRANKYEPFRTRTERFRNSCIPHCVSNLGC